jgi:RimJ/RimL family protein N-acetyltransferase
VKEPETPAVRLRAYGPDDLWIQQRFLRDPESTAHLGGPDSEEQIARRHQRYLAMTDPAKGAMFVIELEPTGRPAGSVGYWEQVEPDGTVVWETGWYVLPDLRGRGIAAAGTRLAIDAAWAAVRRPVHAYPNVDNGPSNTICRKLGMRLLGESEYEYPKGHWMTCNDWAIDPPREG